MLLINPFVLVFCAFGVLCMFYGVTLSLFPNEVIAKNIKANNCFCWRLFCGVIPSLFSNGRYNNENNDNDKNSNNTITILIIIFNFRHQLGVTFYMVQ